MRVLISIRKIVKKLSIILSKEHKKLGIVVLLMSLIGAIIETLGVSVIFPLVQVMMEPEALLNNRYIFKLYTSLELKSVKQLLGIVVTIVIIIYILKNAYLCILSYVRVKYSSKVQRELSIHMLYSYMNRGYDFFRKNNTSRLLNGINDAVGGVYNIIYQAMRMFAEGLTIVCIFIYILYTDAVMAISMIVLVGTCLLVILSIFKKIMEKAGKKYFDYRVLTNKWSLQLFSGVKELLVTQRADYFVKQYENAYQERQDGQIKQTLAIETPAYVIEGACVTGIILAVFFRIGNVENPTEYVPKLAVFAMAAFRLLPSIGRITSYFNDCIFNFAAVDEVYENVLESKKFIGCKPQENVLTDDTNINFEKELCIRNIEWTYADGTEKVLDGLSVVIKKGEAVAFIGSSGGGKSTLVDIILGLLNPQKGEVLLDNYNICSCKKAVAKLIGYVPQSVYLIDDSIKRNIAFGIADEDIDENAIWDALEKAQIDDYIKKLPEGIETIVGERGVRFSGGQAQRLAIARALYSDPEILILDEATSALDNDTEKAVMQAIDSLQGKKTLIIVAHRLTTIRNCDKIFEIIEGKAIEKKYDQII